MRKYIVVLFAFVFMLNPLNAKNTNSNSKNNFLATSELIITPSQNEEVSPYSEIEVFIPVEIEESSINKLSLRLKLQKALENAIPSKWVEGVISYSDSVLKFNPNEPLVYGSYKAVIAKQLKSDGKFILQKPFQWEFSVTPTAKIPIKSISLESEVNSLNIGETTNLLVIATYVDNSTSLLQEDITFSTSNEAIVTVDETGLLTAKGEGIVNISATVEGFSDSLSLEIKNPLQSISVTPNTLTLNEGESFSIKVIGSYLDGSQKDLTTTSTFNVSNESIISIDSSGNINALSAGSATIEVSYENFVESLSVEVVKVVNETNTTITPTSNFANSYSDLIATNATIDKFDEKRFCVINGKVKAIDDTPLSNVEVSIKGHSEYGSVKTNGNGEFAIAIEGGGVVTIRYQKDGFATSDRKIDAPWRDIVIADDITMLQRDTKVTKVKLDGTKQTHTSSLYSDDRGERATTLVFNGVSKATITYENGTTEELSELNVRATEFVTEKSMPADLPVQSAYTFCSDLTVDEAKDIADITFDKPIVMYVDNFLGFDVGEIVPVGYYDREEAVWKASDNGVVVKLLDSDNDGVVDSLDSDGDDIANDLNGNGSVFDEVGGLEDSTKYIAGNTYWRAKITHFTPWDFNWPYGPPLDATNPDTKYVDSDEDEPKTCPVSVNSYIDPSTRSFHEDILVAGTDLTLHYSSSRVDGYKHKVTIPTGNPAGSATSIFVTMQIAGKTYQKYLPPTSNQIVEFIWDGRDFRDKVVSGKAKAKITITYIYPMVYYRSPTEWARAFGRLGGEATAIRGRSSTSFSKTFVREFLNTPRSDIANGWSLSNHAKWLSSGEFESGEADIKGKSLASIITTIAGNGVRGFCGDEGNATDACLNYPSNIEIDSKGNFYILDSNNLKIRKVDKNGIITTIINNINSFCYTKETCTNYNENTVIDREGNLYIIDILNTKIYKIDTNGIITIVVGNGTRGFCGDGGDATEACLYSPTGITVDIKGNLYIADSTNNRIRKVDTNGIITTVVGNGTRGFCGDGGDATEACLYSPTGITVDIKGNLYIADSTNNRIRKVNTNGIITTVVGNETRGFCGDGGDATKACLNHPLNIAIDNEGNLYIADRNNQRIRKVSHIAGLGDTNLIDNETIYEFDSNLNHSKTIDVVSKKELVNFEYDNNDSLIGVIDRFNNRVTINRNENGKVTSITSPNGHITTLNVNENNNLEAVNYEDGSAYNFSYTNGLMDVMIKPNGESFYHSFDENGRVTTTSDPEGGEWSFSRSASEGASVLTLNTAENEKREYQNTKNLDGSVESNIIMPSGESIFRVTNSDETRSQSQVCGVDSVSEYGYDKEIKENYLSKVTTTLPSGLTKVVEFGRSYESVENFDFTTITKNYTLNSKTTSVVQDIENSTYTTTSPEGRVLKEQYDRDTLLPIQSEVSGLEPTSYSYDTKGRLTSTKVGSRENRYNYNARGNIESFIDSKGLTTSYEYDLLDRIIKVIKPSGDELHFSYSPMGEMTMLRVPTSAEHSFEYNSVGKNTSYTTPLSKVTTYKYDRDRRLIESILASGGSILYTYEGGKLATILTPDWQIDYTYACMDNIASIIKGDEKLEYSYDGDLVKAIVQSGTLNKAINFSYNNDFDITSITYANATNSLSYDLDGLLIASSGFSINRNSLNGLAESVEDSIFRVDRTFNGYSEIDSSNFSINSNSLYSYEVLARDEVGRITSKREVLNGTSIEWGYSYDNLGRLVEVTKDGVVTESYSYDSNGNRVSSTSTERNINATASYTLSDTIETFGNIGYVFDSDGYLKLKNSVDGDTTYSYARTGELLEVVKPDSTIISYTNDPMGRRVAKLINGEIVEKYLWLDRTTLLAIYDKDDNLISRFNYADSRVPYSMEKDGSVYYLAYDQVGSLRAVSDSSGNIVKEVSYDSFGNIITDSNSNFKVPFGFAGGLQDTDIGLVRFGYRDYDPNIGKWTARDPILFEGGDSNLYGYVLNDPINLVDPTGENPLILFLLGSLTSYLNSPDIGEEPKSGITPEAELSMCLVGGELYKTPHTLYHFTSSSAKKSILENGLKIGTNNLYGKGVYATRYNSKILAKIQGANSVQSKIIIQNTSGFRPTLFPGTFKSKQNISSEFLK